jgi:predicted nucleic acid-binding protein
MAAELILCDTNILIELSKNNSEIVRELKGIGQESIAVSSISAAEFIFGALNKKELSKIKNALSAIDLLHVDREISDTALELLEKYSLSHNLTVPDAFIASTSLTHELKLFTLNIKDFKPTGGLILYKFQ